MDFAAFHSGNATLNTDRLVTWHTCLLWPGIPRTCTCRLTRLPSYNTGKLPNLLLGTAPNHETRHWKWPLRLSAADLRKICSALQRDNTRLIRMDSLLRRLLTRNSDNWKPPNNALAASLRQRKTVFKILAAVFWRPALLQRFITFARQHGLRNAFLLALAKSESMKSASRPDNLNLATFQLRAKAKEFDANFRQRNYQQWIKTVESDSRKLLESSCNSTQWTQSHPSFSIIMPVYNSNMTFLTRAVDSVRAQLYPNWQLCICDDASTNSNLRPYLQHLTSSDPRIRVTFRDQNGHIAAASNSAIELAQGDFLSFLDHDDELEKHALYLVADDILRHPETNLVYSDHDKIDTNNIRFDPYFKPDYNLDLLRSQNYIDHLASYRTSLVRSLGGLRTKYDGSQDYDLVLRTVDASRPNQIRHVPHILYHWRAIPGSIAFSSREKSYAPARSRAALEDHLSRRQLKAQVLPAHPDFSLHRVKYEMPSPAPLVSIIIPTRDQAELLQQCVDSIIIGTDYPSIEVIIVDNLSQEPETAQLLERATADKRVRVVKYDLAFNYSAINNMAANIANGKILCFLNNDVWCVNADWLEEMVRHATRPEVGAVGARLLYPAGYVQHSGIIAGYRGLAGHAFRYLPQDMLGPWARAVLIQNYLAVTGACMLIRKDLFFEVGQFNQSDLPVVFNDVDLCLRLHEAGYRNVFTPYAELTHAESTTRKTLAYEFENQYFRSRWSEFIVSDPYFNPNLDRASESFLLPKRSVRVGQKRRWPC